MSPIHWRLDMCVTTCLRNVVKFTPMNTAVAYATDENYVRLTAVSLYSLLHVNPGATVIILADGISNASVDLFRRIAARTGGTLRFLDAAAAIKRVKGTGAGGYVSFSAYSRLFLPDLGGCFRSPCSHLLPARCTNTSSAPDMACSAQTRMHFPHGRRCLLAF